MIHVGDNHREWRCGTCGTLLMESRGTTAPLSAQFLALVIALEMEYEEHKAQQT
jgi:hypothetical protein